MKMKLTFLLAFFCSTTAFAQIDFCDCDLLQDSCRQAIEVILNEKTPIKNRDSCLVCGITTLNQDSSFSCTIGDIILMPSDSTKYPWIDSVLTNDLAGESLDSFCLDVEDRNYQQTIAIYFNAIRTGQIDNTSFGCTVGGMYSFVINFNVPFVGEIPLDWPEDLRIVRTSGPQQMDLLTDSPYRKALSEPSGLLANKVNIGLLVKDLGIDPNNMVVSLGGKESRQILPVKVKRSGKVNVTLKKRKLFDFKNKSWLKDLANLVKEDANLWIIETNDAGQLITVVKMPFNSQKSIEVASIPGLKKTILGKG